MSRPSSDGISQDKPYAHHNELSRQMTVTLTPDQYERLYFQPTAGKGDLAKRLGNPTLLGLLGFLIPFTATVFALLSFQGSDTTSLTAFSGSMYFFGAIALILSGIMEFILGNTYPMVVFITFGCHWINIGYIYDPTNALAASYGAQAGLTQAYNAGMGNYDVAMLLLCFVFLIGSIRTNVPFVIIFITLVFVFGFFAAGSYQLGFDSSAAGIAHALYYFKIAGGFGFVTILMGWYLTIITVCASTGVPCPLPIFDLSTKVFAGSKAAAGEHAGSVQKTSAQARDLEKGV